MSDGPSRIRAHARAVRKSGVELRSESIEQRIRWLSDASTTLAARAMKEAAALSAATGLSEPMVAWAARTTLDTIREDTMKALVRDASRDGDPLGMLGVVLAGNVFTAAVRTTFVPLLFGVPVLVKASSRETAFPHMMCDALRRANPRLGAAVEVVVFDGGDLDAEAALVEHADAVSVYGSDQTVEAMRKRLADKPLMAHGHGVSVAYCSAEALEDHSLDATIAGLALDVCAYDQRGCLSPQVVFVEGGGRISPRDFARRLVQEGLRPMGETLPRGVLAPEAGAAQAQWRGVAEVEGELLSGSDHAVAIRPPVPIRWSPGYRNVTLSPVADLKEVFEVITTLGQSLKCIGSDPGSLEALAGLLDQTRTLEAYACPIGRMQTPDLDAPSDGRPIWAGLTRR